MPSLSEQTGQTTIFVDGAGPAGPLQVATFVVEGTTETAELFAKIDPDGKEAIYIRRSDGTEEPYQSQFRLYVGSNAPAMTGRTNDLYLDNAVGEWWQRINGTWTPIGSAWPVFGIGNLTQNGSTLSGAFRIASGSVLLDMNVPKQDLSAYATTASLSPYAKTVDLSVYAQTSALSNYPTNAQTDAKITAAVGAIPGYTPQVTAPITYTPGTGKIGFDPTGFVTTSGLTTALGPYAKTSDLSGYVTTAALSGAGYLTSANLSGYATTQVLTNAIAGVTLTFSPPLSKSGATVSIPSASASQDGFMPATSFADLATAKTNVAALQASLAVLQSRQQAVSVAVANIALGVTANATVTWPTPFADANYNVQLTVQAPASALGVLSIPVVVTKTASGVTLSIKNVSLSLGSGAFSIDALATHY